MKEKVAFYDILRIEDGKEVEHWGTYENIIPEEDTQNTNGKFNFKKKQFLNLISSPFL